jgi:hypothetical protein
MKAALEPVEVFEGICERCCDVGSRLAVQPLWLDQPGTSSRIPKRAFKVPSGLGVAVGALPTGSVTSGKPQPSEPGVVHDHIWLREHQIVAITYIGVRLVRHVKHTGTAEGSEAVGGSACGSQLSPCGGSTEMVSDRRSDADREVLVKGLGENLLPSTRAW